MEITREYLEQQRDQLASKRDAHLSEANAAHGAVLICEQLLAYLDAEKPEDILPAVQVPGVAEPINKSKESK